MEFKGFEVTIDRRNLGHSKLPDLGGSPVPGELLDYADFARLVTLIVSTADLLFTEDPGCNAGPGSPERQVYQQSFDQPGIASGRAGDGEIA